jgi:biopolymer transport protein TolR
MSGQRKQRNRISSDINVTPMADIMLVLLIIFMITTPLLQEEVFVNLPDAENPMEINAKEPMMVTLTRDGRIYIGKSRVTEPEMMHAITEQLASYRNQTMYLKADQMLEYGKVVHIVQQCNSLGVEHIGLMTEKHTLSEQ